VKQTILFQLKSLTLTHEPEALPDVKEAIAKTILGNPGGIQYRQRDALKKVKEIKPLHFFPLRKNGKLLLVMALAERITYNENRAYYTYYVRYVSFNPAFTVKSLTHSNSSQSLYRIGNSFMKEGMKKHAENFAFTLKDSNADASKKIYYAYVEESNIRSLNFTEFFFEKIRDFTIITYSNLFPHPDRRVLKIQVSDLDRMTRILENEYLHHSFFFLEKEKLLSDYYVLKENDEILTGVQARITNWKIEELPGITGKIIKNILPYVPLLSRFIKPGRFTFLTFDTMYCTNGNEHLIPLLFRAVCAILNVYAGMIYIDSKDPLCARIRNLRNMGFLNRVYKNAKGVLVTRFVNFTDKEKQEFIDHPVYISGYDLT